MRTTRLILVLFVGFAVGAHAEDWPHWRGPSATGVSGETGLPTTWTDTENIAWKAQLRGAGVSSPIVLGDRVFVTSQLGRGPRQPGPRLVQSGIPGAAGELPLGGGDAGASVSFLVTALDRDSGRQAWEYELAAKGGLQRFHEKHNLASSSPVTDGERVYAWFGSGQIVALATNGELVWERHLGEEYAPFTINWGHGSSPVVYGDTLILLCYHERASYLLGLDAVTGEVRWKADRGRGVISYSTPLIVETGESAEIIVNSSEGISGHDPATGELLWRIAEDNRFPIPMPVVHDGVIYASRGYRSGPFMALRPGGRGDVTDSHVMWRVGTGAPYISSLVYDDGLVYMIGDVGILTVTDAGTGERVWQERLGGVFSASPVAADGKIYLLSEGGETIVLAAGRQPRVIARNDLDIRQLASPAISGGRLFIRSDSMLFAIGQ
jgi:outer membrane protein assembly factor BamB